MYFLLQYISVAAVYLPIRYVFPTQSSNWELTHEINIS